MLTGILLLRHTIEFCFTRLTAVGRVLLFTLRKFTPDEGLLCVAKRL
jgi:hypothetical protein